MLGQQDPTQLKKLFLVHGEAENMAGFKAELEIIGFSGVEIPSLGQRFEL